MVTLNPNQYVIEEFKDCYCWVESKTTGVLEQLYQCGLDSCMLICKLVEDKKTIEDEEN